MTKEEIKKALLDGKKLRLPAWEVGEYIYFDFETLCVMDENNKTHHFQYWDSYEIYEKPIDSCNNELKENDICLFCNELDDYKVIGIFRHYKDGYYHGYTSYGFQIETKHLYCEKINLDELR